MYQEKEFRFVKENLKSATVERNSRYILFACLLYASCRAHHVAQDGAVLAKSASIL